MLAFFNKRNCAFWDGCKLGIGLSTLVINTCIAHQIIYGIVFLRLRFIIHFWRFDMDRRGIYIGVGLIAFFASLSACTPKNKNDNTLFRLLDPSHTGISFINQLEYTEKLNPYTFKSFYNGGGVGLGDFNNDGLLDIFFSGNMVPNKLYLNQGRLKFIDITETAGLSARGVWSTGVSVADINGDGFLDIYICRSGPPGGERRANELFINNGDRTFTESAKRYGLAFEGLAVHAAFFDFDRDGDLDCYLLNNSLRSVGGYDLRKGQRETPDTLGGNKLLRNDGDIFTDVTTASGIYSSEIGFGLGVTIGDINRDGWLDMFVSNDFFEKDYLYVNNGDGTFKECLEDHMREISLGSMGADMGDLNNDGFPEIYVTEMLPEHDARLKTTAQFDNWDKFIHSYKMGYWRQFGRNVLQLNNGDGSFSEVGRYSGVHATDWSWGALIFDMDNDGMKDLFVANGIYKDLLDQDYVSFAADPATVRQLRRSETEVIRRLIDSIPSQPISNYAFRNVGNMRFVNETATWGLNEPSYSNGSAYGDLDNDGDLDLVLNNVNMPARVYENTAAQNLQNHSLSITLKGTGKNHYALGATVTVYDSGKLFYQEVSPMRGFMSTVDSRVIFGIGRSTNVDSVRVDWPDGRHTTKFNIAAGTLQIDAADAHVDGRLADLHPQTAFRREQIAGASFLHEENDYVDFNRDRLLFNMTSSEGPCFCKGDVNRDGRDDFYIGGGKGQEGGLFVQNANGSFSRQSTPALKADHASEDIDCVFFDANGDGWQDLYVASGGSEFSPNSAELLSRLYFNEQGRWRKSDQAFPTVIRFENSSSVSVADIDGDNDLDLFTGTRMVPSQYGAPASSYLLRNDGKGKFRDDTGELAPVLGNLGLVTDGEFADINGDGKPDLVVVGEWMPVKVLLQEDGRFVDRSSSLGLDSTHGWYNSLCVHDLNGDGFPEIVTGNHGLNSRFKASRREPLSMYVNDFDQNGTIEHITTYYDQGKSYPLVLRGDLVAQMPGLKRAYLHFRNYKEKAISDIFPEIVLEKSLKLNAYDFSSAVWINRNGKSFEQQPLPWEAQLFPLYAITCADFDKDGILDLLIGGNLSRAKPETGSYDAGYGLLLKGTRSGRFVSVPGSLSGVHVVGEVRQLHTLRIANKKAVAVVRNNDSLEFLTY